MYLLLWICVPAIDRVLNSFAALDVCVFRSTAHRQKLYSSSTTCRDQVTRRCCITMTRSKSPEKLMYIVYTSLMLVRRTLVTLKATCECEKKKLKVAVQEQDCEGRRLTTGSVIIGVGSRENGSPFFYRCFLYLCCRPTFSGNFATGRVLLDINR